VAMDEDLKRLIEETSAATQQRFDEAVGELRQENVQTRQHFDVVAAALRQETRNVDARLTQENVETRQHFDAVASDLRRHFDATAEDFRTQVQLVAEGVVTVNERVDRLAHEMKSEFAESKAMMRFSFADVDRRLRSLEDRVERLETSRTQ